MDRRLMLVCLLATRRADSRKNTPKKQHLYIENYNSGPNMQTTTSLPFFTAIFVALGGALAEELMICGRHVITELYIYIDSMSRDTAKHRLQSNQASHRFAVNSTMIGLARAVIFEICGSFSGFRYDIKTSV